MISVIIPTLNEELALPNTLDHLFRQSSEFEVFVVDGGSTDRTRELVVERGNINFLESQKGRAVQMNKGATNASGEWLLFLHADTLLTEGALTLISRLDPSIGVGGFKHRFSGKSKILRLISALHNVRCRLTRNLYGDQAMFVRKALFDMVGGFPVRQHMEDIYFCKKIRKISKPVLLNVEVVTDSRKFEKMGEITSFAQVAIILFSVLFHQKIPKFGMRFFNDVR